MRYWLIFCFNQTPLVIFWLNALPSTVVRGCLAKNVPNPYPPPLKVAFRHPPPYHGL